MRVCVLDIEPIEPTEGGSRLRLKGLYHALGPDIDVAYVGAFHWKGPVFRRLRHGPRFEEITVPFSDAHFAAAADLQKQVGDYDIIDSSFPLLATLSPEYGEHARAAAGKADVVVISHPWTYSVVAGSIDRTTQLLVYDAHNVETVLKRKLLGTSETGIRIADEVERVEGELCRAAALVVACSHHDARLLEQTFDLPSSKVRIVPNGTFTGEIVPAGRGAKAVARLRLGLGRRPVALFIGGLYPPNTDAALFIRDALAPRCPDTVFAIVGRAGDALREGGVLPDNVRLAGHVSEAVKRRWLAAADVGINPMFSGSGTNIKMFDYMSAGLAVVTTPFGARGLEAADASRAGTAEAFAERLDALTSRKGLRAEAGRRNRAFVTREFEWHNISAEFGAVMLNHRKNLVSRPPFFSVTVPTLNRPDKLRRLLDLLGQQTDRDFEVIVVDQSDAAFPTGDYGYDLTIVQSRVRGQAHARNVAAAAARGTVIVCTDDDCEPCDGWLAAARAHFEEPGVVGVEGRCFSDRYGDPAWRTVDNYGVEGIGFMTCNLFVAAHAFRLTGGFDVAFDERQFRYDTDFGWRLLDIGKVPFSEDAFVYHPPWRRNLSRESEAARDAMFEADALLLRKHPDRYRDLFLIEGHWRKGRRFREPFLRGVNRLGVALPDYIRERL